MTIKEAIERGLYPKDEKGRALVPISDGSLTYTIVCTDRPGSMPLMGFCADITNSFQSWDENGWCGGGLDLLPPPPRKVRHMATLCIPWRDGKRDAFRLPTVELGDITSAAEHNKEWKYVLLTGETEEPWT